MFDLSARRELNRGFSESFGRGFDLALTPVAVGAIGWLLDRWLGTDPILTLAFAVVGVVGTFVKLWIGYDRQMRREDEGKPWARPTATTRPPAPGAAPAAGGTAPDEPPTGGDGRREVVR